MSHLTLDRESRNGFLEASTSTVPLEYITVMLVDDHALIRAAISQALSPRSEVKLVVVARNYTEAEALVGRPRQRAGPERFPAHGRATGGGWKSEVPGHPGEFDWQNPANIPRFIDLVDVVSPHLYGFEQGVQLGFTPRQWTRRYLSTVRQEVQAKLILWKNSAWAMDWRRLQSPLLQAVSSGRRPCTGASCKRFRRSMIKASSASLPGSSHRARLFPMPITMKGIIPAGHLCSTTAAISCLRLKHSPSLAGLGELPVRRHHLLDIEKADNLRAKVLQTR